MSTKKYIVKTTVHHDNQVFEPDTEIELEDHHADALLAVKAIELAPESDGDIADDATPASAKKKK